MDYYTITIPFNQNLAKKVLELIGFEYDETDDVWYVVLDNIAKAHAVICAIDELNYVWNVTCEYEGYRPDETKVFDNYDAWYEYYTK